MKLLESNSEEEDEDEFDDQLFDEDADAEAFQQEFMNRDESASVLLNNDEFRKSYREVDAKDGLKFTDDYSLVVNEKMNHELSDVKRPFTSVDTKFKLLTLN